MVNENSKLKDGNHSHPNLNSKSTQQLNNESTLKKPEVKICQISFRLTFEKASQQFHNSTNQLVLYLRENNIWHISSRFGKTRFLQWPQQINTQ
jgi:hypothetical protein